MRRDACSIVANWPAWKQQIRLTKYSPEVDFGENKIMSVKRYEITDGDESRGYPACMDESADGAFVLFSDYAAIKEENDQLKARVEELEQGLRRAVD